MRNLGEYPRHLHGEVNFKQVISYQALIGGLLVMLGVPEMMKRKKLMHGSKSFAIVLGRVSSRSTNASASIRWPITMSSIVW